MQPYLFPYLGYFQLIAAVDKFVVHDDVQYIKGRWINRNRILINNKPYLFTFSIKKDPFFLKINQRTFAPSFPMESKKFLKLLYQAYHKAIRFKQTYALLEDIMSYSDNNISKFVTNSLQKISRYLDIDTPFILSSEIEKNDKLKGQDRVININSVMQSTHYINPIGGTELYSKDEFKKKHIKLNFIKMNEIKYLQFGDGFVSNLSMIDVLMFNDKKSIKQMLSEYVWN